MSKSRVIALTILAFVVCGALAVPVLSHCQVPCGIYNDQMRFDMIAEHITTIEKSMKEIEKLSADDEKNHNQITRWVANKDDHADQLSHIVTYYFLAQRIAPVDPGDAAAHAGYLNKLELLHRMVVGAMKAKQTTDLGHVAELRELSKAFQEVYFGQTGEEAHEPGSLHQH